MGFSGAEQSQSSRVPYLDDWVACVSVFKSPQAGALRCLSTLLHLHPHLKGVGRGGEEERREGGGKEEGGREERREGEERE